MNACDIKLGVCFYCGKETGEIGARLSSLEPCSFCKNMMKQGIILIEAVIQEGKPIPCGGYAVIQEALLDKVCNAASVSTARQKRMVFLSPEAWDKVGLPR